MAEATFRESTADVAVRDITPSATTAAVNTTIAFEPAAGANEIAEEYRFEFTGSGSEYFRIWVVNVLLSILTLGVYSAWAKVRRMQYFHRNTVLAGAVFDYHGKASAILKGRLLALVLLATYHVSSGISFTAGATAMLVLAAISPWLLARAFKFKLANTSYRGLRFHFRGTVGEAYRMLILFPLLLAAIGLFVWSLATSFSRDAGLALFLFVILLPLLAVGGTVPLAHYYLKRYQHELADFGQTPFFFNAQAIDFFRIYGKATGMVVLGSVAGGVFAAATAGFYGWVEGSLFGSVFAVLITLLNAYVFYLFIRPYMESRLQNLVWNHTELGMHRFESRARARTLLGIHASNLLLITLTLGLYKPYAAVRLAKYRIESLTLVPGAGMDEFQSDPNAERVGAAGQEAGDLFDIDIAL
jgi:uncharacterized membrane protein YjgN (DUF898 family)